MTAHHAISVAAEAIRDEAASLMALGPAVSADRLQEAVSVLRLGISQLERNVALLEWQERDPRLLIGVEPSSLGGWWKR